MMFWYYIIVCIFTVTFRIILLFVYLQLHLSMKSIKSCDSISQFSIESSTSGDSKDPVYIAAGDIRRRLSENISAPKGKFEVKFFS